jgi:hypothetical protein
MGRLVSRCVWVAGWTILATGRAAPADWPTNGFPVAVAPCEELPTSVVADGAGGVYVVWTDNRTCSHNDVFVQRLGPKGDIAPGWPAQGLPIFPTTGGQGSAIATSDGEGGLIVVWFDGRTGTTHVMAQRIGPGGSPLWDAAGVRVSDADGDGAFQILTDGASGVFVAWRDGRRGLNDGPPHFHRLYDLYAQHLDASGTRLWAAVGQPVSTNVGYFDDLTLVSDGGSGVLITWADGPAYLQHLDAAGTAQLPTNGVAIPGLFLGNAVADGLGGILSAFTYGPDTQEDLYVQRVDANGAIQLPLNGVLVASANYGQRVNDVLATGDGGAFVTWYDLRNGLDWDVYVQRVTATGAAYPGWPANGLAVAALPGFQIYPRIITDGAGGCVIVWYDARDAAAGYDIYAQRIRPDATLGPLWPVGGALLCHASGDQTSPLPAPDGSGGALVAWSDYRDYADVYLQRVTRTGVVGGSGTINVEPPGLPGFALGRPHPNPVGDGRVFVPVSLAAGPPAQLSLLDLHGRCVWRRSVEGGAGPFTFELNVPRNVANGVYWLQLRQAERTQSSRISILR